MNECSTIAAEEEEETIRKAKSENTTKVFIIDEVNQLEIENFRKTCEYMRK